MKNPLYFFVSIILACVTMVQAQTYQVPSSGSNTITACGGTIYDPGGTGSYPSSCSGYLIVNPSEAGCRASISGTYYTESGWDKIYIYDGAGTNGTLLGQFEGSGTIPTIISVSGPLTIRFTSDGSVCYDGFAFTLDCTGGCDCGSGPSVSPILATGNQSIMATWGAVAGVTNYFLEYGRRGFTPGTGTRITTTSTTYTISNLTNGVAYDVYVWADCGNDNQITDEIPGMATATPSNAFNVPASGNNTITTCGAILYDCGGADGNYESNANGYTIIYPENPTCVVHLEGPFNTESCCDHIYIYDGAGVNGTLLGQFEGGGNIDVTSTQGPITVKFTSDGSVVKTGFALDVTCRGGCDCGSGPFALAANMTDDGFQLTWSPGLDPNVHGFFVEYGPVGFTLGNGTRVYVTNPEITIPGLTVGATYDFYVYYDCGGDQVLTDEIPTLVTYCIPDGTSCIDFSDWNNPAITCTTGDYDNNGHDPNVYPYAVVGRVDGRHTIVTEPTFDEFTNGGLRTIPDCGLYSVKLGNSDTGSEAESITYEWTVDTTIGDILVLQYAAVLENPSGHTDTEQPRFTFDLLDQANQRIDPTCGWANFISGSTTDGWNQTTNAGETLYWKDWTTVGFDVSRYHGQTIRIRLTTYDCTQSGHFGYAYFTLNCKKRTITAETCGEIYANTYTAPAGFDYAWYLESNPNNIISTDQSCTITVTDTSDVLHCRVSFIGRAECNFDLTTSISSRYPLAQFVATRDGCSNTYQFSNQSTISVDGVNPSGTNEGCESAYWDFGDGTTSTQYSPDHEFPGPGRYLVQLIAGISQDECQDTLTMMIDLLDNAPRITGNFDICNGERVVLNATGGTSYEWLVDGQIIGTGPSIEQFPETTTTYTLNSIGADDCEVTIHQEVIVRQPTTAIVNDETCQGERYTGYGFTLPPHVKDGDYLHTRVEPNQHGCDSLITLNLTVKPTPDILLGQDRNHCFNDDGNVVLTVHDGDCDSYMWSTGENSRFISVATGGTYAVTATRAGCSEDGSVTIHDNCPIYIYLPNCITPTDVNGINDVFKLSSATDIKELSIVIYDRWGRVVFSSNDPNFQWDGNINGKYPSNAVYTYTIHLTTTANEQRMIKGVLTVL